MNKNAGGMSGIGIQLGATLNTNNVVVRGATLGVAVRYESSAKVDYTYLISSWANSVYGTDSNKVEIYNSYIKDSGGSAIYIEDTESRTDATTKEKIYTDGEVYIDINTKVENYITGAEGYFNAYGMTAAVLMLKANANVDLETNHNRTTVIATKNYLGLDTEMINFTFMLCVNGKNLYISGILC